MNEVTTVLTAKALEPKTRIRDRSHATSYASAAAPEAKTRSPRRAKMGDPATVWTTTTNGEEAKRPRGSLLVF
jgi:hypothetical protein